MNNWLDKYEQGGLVLKQKTKDNYGKKANPNNPDVKLPPGFKGLAYNTKGRNYSPAWGGQFEDGGNIAQKGKSIPVPTTADSARLFNAQTALNNFYAKEMKAGRIKKGAEAKSMAGNPYYSFPNKLRELNEENLDFYRIEIRDRIKHKGGADDDYYKDYFNLSPEKVRNLENTGLAMTKSGSEYQQYYRDLITPMQNLAAPFALVDSRILPQRTINYESTVPAYPGGNVMVYDYDPLAIKPYHMRTDKEKIEWEKKYGKGTPITSSTKKPTTSTEKSKTAPEKKKTSVVKKSEETKPTKTEETKPTPYTPKGSKKYIVNGVEVSEEDFLGLDNTTGGSKRIIYSTPKLGSQKVLRLDGTPETDPEKIRKALATAQKNEEFQDGGNLMPAMAGAVQTVPMAQNGGLWNTDKTAWVDSIHNARKGDLNFVQRMFDQRAGSIQIPGQRGTSTHFMESGDKRAYPTVVQMPNGKLQYLNQNDKDAAWNYAKRTKQFIQFPTDEQAEWYANDGYKKGTGVLEKKQMGGSIPGAVGFTYARVAGSAPSNGKYAKKTKASAQDGKVVQEKRHSNLYSPIESKIDAAIKSYDEYYNLPGSTQRFIDRYVKASPSVYDVRNIPPVDPVISEVQQKIQGLSNKEVNKLLHTDWSKMGIVGAMKNTPSNVSYPEMLKYISHFNKLKKKGYTFQNGGDMKYYQEGLDFKPKTISQDGKEVTHTHRPGMIYDDSGMVMLGPGEHYMLKRTVTPYKSKRDIKKFTQTPTDPRQVNFLSNYAGALGEPLRPTYGPYPTSVPIEGKKHWNIDRFIIDPQAGRNYENLNNDNSSKKEIKNNILADMYKYYMLQNKGDRDDAWKQANKFVRQEINPKLKGPVYNSYLRDKLPMSNLDGIETLIKDQYMHDYNSVRNEAFAEYPDVQRTDDDGNLIFDNSGNPVMRSTRSTIAQDFLKNPISKNYAKRFGMDWLMKYKGLSRKEAKNTLNKTKKIPNFEEYKGDEKMDSDPSKWEDGGAIVDPMGQWAHPGEVTIIPSTDITMEGVDYPVLGISDTGDQQMMYPGEDYQFDGEYVTEYPVAKKGISVNNADAQPIKKLDQLLNFTNYNKPTKGGWLSKYQYGGGVLSRSNLETMAALEKDIKNQKARNAQETVSQYTSKPRDQQRMNAAKDAYRAEEAKPLNRAASSRVAAKAMENIVEPMLAIETGMGAGKLVKPALETAGKYLTEKTALKNAYKINPYAFKPNKTAAYRMIGDERGYIDAVESGFLKPGKGSDIGKMHTETHFQMGVPSDKREYFGRTWSRGYDGPYMAEVLNAANDARFSSGPGGKLMGNNVWTYPENYIPTSQAKIYKQDWLKGYKEIAKKEDGGWLNKYK